jgi:signal transduction histidine kinase
VITPASLDLPVALSPYERKVPALHEHLLESRVRDSLYGDGRPAERRISRLAPVIVASAAGLAALATLLISVLPVASFAYRSPSGHVGLETGAALIAVLAAFLVYGRFRRTAQLRDLVLFAGLATLAGTSLLLSAALAIAGADPDGFATWAPLLGRTLGAVGLAAAAFMPARRLVHPGRGALLAVAVVACSLAAVAALVAILGEHLPAAIEPHLSPESSDRPRVVADPAILVVQLFAMLCFVAAALGFMRRAERTADELIAWFAGAAVLAAFARLNYFLFPSIFSEWIYTGDFLRLGSYILFLVGCAREISAYQRALPAAAAAEERRWLAREFHDGLAQELAFLASGTRQLVEAPEDSPPPEKLSAAARRAMRESRSILTLLTERTDKPLDAAVAEAAQEVAERAGARLKLDLDPAIRVEQAAVVALARIVHQALTNAVCDGGASAVVVRLSRLGSALRLRVTDNGNGFDPSAIGDDAGFGLTSMKERAEALGGEFHVLSRSGFGTVVEVVVP